MRLPALLLVCLFTAQAIRCETPLFTLAQLGAHAEEHHAQIVRVKGFWLFDFESCVISDTAEFSESNLPLPLRFDADELTRNSPREFEFLNRIRGFVELCRTKSAVSGQNIYVVEVELEGLFLSWKRSDYMKKVEEDLKRTGKPQPIPYPHNSDQFKATKIISIATTLKTRPNQPLQGTPGTVPSSSTEPEARRP